MSPPTLRLRPWHAADLPALWDLYRADADLVRQFPPVSSIEDLQDWLHRYAKLDEHNAVLALDIDGELAGCVAVLGKCENANGWVFYWLASRHRGRGYVSAALTTLANWALKAGGWYRLELAYRTNNPSSGRTAGRAGFMVEGLEREKFLIDGERIDVQTAARLATDPVPTPQIPVELQLDEGARA